MILLFVYHDIVIHHLGNTVNYSEFTFNYNTLLAFKKDIESSTKGDQEGRAIRIHIHEKFFYNRGQWDVETSSDSEIEYYDSD